MLLSFDKPKKVASTEDHNKLYQSDSGVAGTYVPNMSNKDMFKWKAKKIKGKDPRVEIRKMVSGTDPSRGNDCNHYSAQILIVIRPSTVIMSANARMVFTHHVWYDMQEAIEEAKEILLEMTK